MPSKINAVINPIITSINILKGKINILTDSIEILKINHNSLKSRLTNTKTTAEKALKGNKPYGLTDLIAGKTPTFSGWTNDPTDASNITDGDISTFCTTGNKIAGGGWQFAIFEWDLGALYNIICGGVGKGMVTAGNPYLFLYFWDGATWVDAGADVNHGTTFKVFATYSAVCSKVRIGIASNVAATITPNIREFHVWRLK